MRFSHNFGSFHPSVVVDGATLTFDMYKDLPKADRMKLRDSAVERCVEANRNVSATVKVLQDNIRAAWQPKFDAVVKPGKKATRQEKAEYRRAIEQLTADRQRELVAVWDEPRLRIEGCTYPAAVHDIITVWESKVETDREKLERYLANFDWYYEYSDDFRVWSAGNARAMEIRTLVGKLGAEGQAMFDAARPK